MSQAWVAANMAAFLPPELVSILDSLDGIVSAAKIPLNLVNTALNTAKVIAQTMSLLNPINFLGALADLVQQFKDEFFASGIYVCDMWAYPLYQMRPLDYGPDNTYGNINLRGSKFSESFFRDLYSSFTDEGDHNRPITTGACALLVLVSAVGSIQDLTINPGEDNIGDTFSGFSRYISRAGYSVGDAQFDYYWGQTLKAANTWDYTTSNRVKRIQTAIRMYKQLEPEERSAILTPVNPITGVSFYTDGSIPEWKDIEEVVRSVEYRYTTSRYPDWSRATIRDINPQLVDLFDSVIDPILDLLRSGSTMTDGIIALISAIQGKLKQLTEILDTIDRIILEMELLLTNTGMYGLFVTAQTGVGRLLQELNNTTNPPLNGGYGFYSGIALLATGPSFEPFKAFFSAIANS
jgi:hypothetical protein